MEELPVLFEQSPGLQHINLEFSEIESLDPILPVLCQFTQLKELLLFGNRLESLPQSLSCLKYLEKLDISNNLIQDVQDILPALSTLPSLIELQISIHSEVDEDLIIKSLPKLITLNGVTIERNNSDHLDASKSSENLKSSEEIQEESKNSEEKQEEYENTEEIVQDISEDIEKTYLACEQSGYFGEDVYMSQEYVEKIAIFYDEIRELWHSQDKSKDKKLAEDFDEGIKNIVVDLSGIIKSSTSEVSKKLHTIRSKYELVLICTQKLIDLASASSPLLGSYLTRSSKISEDLFSELLSYSLEKSHSQSPSKGKKETSPSLDYLAEKENLLKRFQEDRQELIEELEMLREENKKYLDTIVRHAKGFAEQAGQVESHFKSFEEVKKVVPGHGLKANAKILTLRQLKEVIDEIYVSKTKYDERCLENKMPKETMEQHMYNYLNTKYGLKNLIVDWASSIVASLKKHCNKDNDVTVFGKILRNECDEEFRLVQSQLKEAVAELVKMILRNKNPLKNNGDIQDMLNDRLNSYLYQDEWSGILKYMYTEEDSSQLFDEIYRIIKKKQHLNVIPPPKGKISRDELTLLKEKEKLIRSRILYKDFLKVLLDYQLLGHEKFLEKFMKIFRQFDTDGDGIINELEFRELVLSMDLGFSEDDIDRLLSIIDPYGNQQITFSEGVGLFTTELIPVGGVAVMKKLSLSD